ncbi:MAG: FAD-dependent oxidoreductase [Chloroflexota bacterium]
MYDLIVIGAGSGGLTAAEFAAQLGAKVALVEKNRIGGDCTWVGCVPSKALLHAGKVVQTAKTAVRYGIETTTAKADMTAVHQSIQQKIADIHQHETAEVLEAKGIEVIFGAANFVDSQTIEVNGRFLTAKKFLLTTGARPFVPPIHGLDAVPFVTYEQIFDNERLPEHLIVLGAGAIGVELAQAYRRLGAAVTVIDAGLLPLLPPEAGQVLGQVFATEEIRVVEGLATDVSYNKGLFAVQVGEQRVTGDMLLAALGRRPNVAGLGLEQAGVVFDLKSGIEVNDRLQTAVSHIYAAGDCIGGQQFTHFAGWQAFQAVRNALLPGSSKGFAATVPATIFTDPEIAFVGLTEAEARKQFGDDLVVTKVGMERVDRAVVDEDTTGTIKILHQRSGTLVGALIIAARAGEMINEFALAIKHGLKIGDLAATIHAYPTYGMGVQRLSAKVATADFLQSTTAKLAQKLAGLG